VGFVGFWVEKGELLIGGKGKGKIKEIRIFFLKVELQKLLQNSRHCGISVFTEIPLCKQ
jgi:hypothetical protein